MHNPFSLMNTDITSLEQMPVRDRICDRLADLMFVADDLLTTVDFNSATNDAVKWVEPKIKEVYDRVNAMMKRLAN